MDDYRDADEVINRRILRAVAEMDYLARTRHCKTPGTFDWQCRNAGIIEEAREAWPDELVSAHIAHYGRQEPGAYE